MIGGMLGYKAFAASVWKADVYLGIGIFSALTAYETH
jgi:hypothetical protein